MEEGKIGNGRRERREEELEEREVLGKYYGKKKMEVGKGGNEKEGKRGNGRRERRKWKKRK